MRSILDSSKVSPVIETEVGGKPEYRQTVDEVAKAIEEHDIVVVGMDQNPFPKKARKLLNDKGCKFHYLEYGSYFTEWKRRGALKMWSGWQTFPMIFVKGVLIGGFSELKAMIDSGEFEI